MSKELTIKVKDCTTIPWELLKEYEFNNLKSETRDIQKLKKSIIKRGFCFPLYIWADHEYVIDGNGRNKALRELEQEGYNIPALPIVEIEAKTKKEAKMRVLQANSDHGNIDRDSISQFSEDIDIMDMDDINIPSFNLSEVQSAEVDYEEGEEIKEVEPKKDELHEDKHIKQFVASLSVAEHDEFRDLVKPIIREHGINNNRELLMFLVRNNNQ